MEKHLFAGFEKLITPLKNDIEQLKNASTCLNCESTYNSDIGKKLQRNDEKHKKLESRLSLIEDRLLEKNLIFQGIYETEYEDNSDIKKHVIRVMAPIMEGDDDEEKRKKRR